MTSNTAALKLAVLGISQLVVDMISVSSKDN
jgi:hypothetical protein